MCRRYLSESSHPISDCLVLRRYQQVFAGLRVGWIECLVWNLPCDEKVSELQKLALGFPELEQYAGSFPSSCRTDTFPVTLESPCRLLKANDSALELSFGNHSTPRCCVTPLLNPVVRFDETKQSQIELAFIVNHYASPWSSFFSSEAPISASCSGVLS